MTVVTTPLDFADVRRARKDPATAPEASVERAFMRRAAVHCVEALKGETLAQGFFDRIVIWGCCKCGRQKAGTHWVELKRPKGARYQKLQREWAILLRRHGHTVHTLDTIKLVEQYFENYICHGCFSPGKKTAVGPVKRAPRAT